MTDVGGWKN